MSERWAWVDERLAELQQSHLYRERISRKGSAGSGRLRLQSGSQSLINFGSNDYLGLANAKADSQHPSLNESISGSGASPLVTGYSPLHEQLERTLADLEGTEAALVFPTGYAANLAVMSSLPEAGDLILSDALNHASIIDGCRLSRAERFIYPHLDIAAIRSLLQLHRHRYRRAFLVTETLFSMDGDFAPLHDIVELAHEFDVYTIVDEAHATGVFGEHGGGLCEAFGVQEDVDIHVGTLSKAIGSLGGFVAGEETLIRYLVNVARPFIFSTAMPDAVARTAIENLDRIRDETELRSTLNERIEQFADGLKWKGFRAAVSKLKSPIVPLVLGKSEAALACATALRTAGYFVPAIRPPTVPVNSARLRISVSAGHTAEEIDGLVQTLNAFRAASLGVS